MTHPGTISSLRFLDRSRLHPEQELQKMWFREQIHSYGVDVAYFRHDADPSSDPSGFFYDYTYGEKTTMSYWLSAHVVGFMTMENDNIMMTKFGLQTDGDASIFILKEDFTEQFRDLVGSPVLTSFYVNVAGSVTGFLATLSGDLVNPDVSGYFLDQFSVLSGAVSGTTSGTFVRYPKAVNPYVYKWEKYTERAVNGTLRGTFSGTVDESGAGTVSGAVSGNVWYYVEDPGKNNEDNWRIAPQVGDFFRLNFDESNHEEYVITKVHDKDFTDDGMNKLLKRYVWKCGVVRRDPSFEEVVGEVGDDRKEEEWTTTEDERVNGFNEADSNQVFEYDTERVDDIDGINSDQVYGGF